MGSSRTTTETNQRQENEPWAPTRGIMMDMIGRIGNQLDDTAPSGIENNAITQLLKNAQTNPFAPGIDSLAHDLLGGGGPDRSGMVTDAYNAYKTDLTGTARGDYLDPNKNPYTRGMLDTVQSDVSNRVNSMFAGAGRDLSGMNTQTLARGIAEGSTPIMADIYNRERQNQLSAMDKLYGAGAGTAGILSGLDQTRLANRQAGAGLASQALQARDAPFMRQLEIEAKRRGMPIQNLAQIANLMLPIAQLGGSSTSQGRQTTTQHANPVQTAIGAALGGIGLLGGMPGLGGMGFPMQLLGAGGGSGWGGMSQGTPGGIGLPGYGRLY